MDQLDAGFSDDPDDVNCVDGEYEELTREHCIKLKKGLYINELLENNGVTFEAAEAPLEQEFDRNNLRLHDESMIRHLNPNYFHDECSGSDSDGGSDEKSPFEKLAKNMVDITGGNGGVLKKVKENGTGEIVAEGSVVTIHYSAFLEYCDEPFDSTFLRNRPLQITLKSSAELCSLIVGLELGIRTMRANESALFLVQPEYAYGPMGCPPRIPGDAVIFYHATLLNIVDYAAAAEFNLLSREEKKLALFERKFAAAKAEHAAGNANFKKNSYHAAIKNYRKAVDLMEKASLRNQDDEDAQKKLLLNVYSNLAMSFLKMNDLPKVLTFCNKVFYHDKDNVKALYRHGKAKSLLGEYQAARISLTRAKRLRPACTEINDALLDVDKKQAKEKEKERIFSSNIFKSSAGIGTEYDNKKSTSQSAVADSFLSAEEDVGRFKNHVNRFLSKFSDGDELRQIVYPGELSFAEMNIFTELAAEYGLHVDTGDGAASVITVYKLTMKD